MNSMILLAAILLYPSATEMWRKGPLTDDVFRVPSASPFVATPLLEKQRKLFPLLQNSTHRSALALELGKSNNPAAFRLLRQLLNTEKDPFVRDDLFRALLQLREAGCTVPGSGTGHSLTPYFSADSPTARSAAMFLYLTSGRNPDPNEVLNALRKETNPLVLDRAGEALRPLAKKLSKSALSSLLDSTEETNPLLRALLAELLAGQENPDDSVLLKKMVRDPNPLVRTRLAEGLADGDSTSLALLTDLTGDSNPAVRLRVAGMKPAPSREVLLGRLLTDASAAVRAAAARSLGKTTLGKDSAARLLVARIGDEDPAVREAAAEALVQLKPDAALRKELVRQGDKQSRGRRQIVDFFARTSDASHSGDLLRWLKTSDDDMLTAETIQVLGRFADASAIPEIIRRAGAKNPSVRRAAAEAFGRLRGPTVFDPLKKLYHDPEVAVSTAALQAMYRIGSPRFRPEFLHALSTRDMGGENRRAIACRGAVELRMSDSATLRNLETLISQECIQGPMAPPMYDRAAVRISALLALLDLSGQGSHHAKALWERQIRLLTEKTGGKADFRDEEFEEYLRQVKARGQNQPVTPNPIPETPPAFSHYSLDTVR